MNAKSKIVKFNNQQIPVYFVGDKPFVAMKPICENIGLQWEAQLKRIKRNHVLNSTMSIMDMVAQDGKVRNVICLPFSMLNGWLMGVDANKVKPEIKDTLIKYQLECYDVLYKHFMPKPRKQVNLAAYVSKQLHDETTLKYHRMFKEYDEMIDQLRDKISSMEDQCRYLDYKLNQYAIDIYEASKLLNVPVSTIEYELLCSHFITKRVPYISDAPVIWSVTERGKRLGLVLIDSIIIDDRAVDLIKLTDDGFIWLKQRMQSRLN
ncbi:phage antirepressor N-terminal domain-containing protein [Acinetobacter lwoffii]|uniref:phage antirepressor N-terminal domain-containing protein n=1 Tax=Acinetobacter lwoffii TaxID=28090 RepID=UPI002DBA64ED|nr:phage antirepressor N-terminal domain-containing protein [Acinetobacter lwoffii]MEB6680286.1 phage antirepressor N-terminal domain-containing protein [Acinetobacter lwoffii]